MLADLQEIWLSGWRKSHLKTIKVHLMIMSPTACLRRKWISSLVRWEEEAGRGGGTGNSGGWVSVPVERGRGWGRGRGAGGLELCGTRLSLSLTVAVSPTVSRHRRYGRLSSKQDTWGTNIKSKWVSNLNCPDISPQRTRSGSVYYKWHHHCLFHTVQTPIK